MRNLPWASIDNDDSRDLDQLTVAETIPGGAVKILVAIADVDALVKQGSAIDDHARQNTTSVYTAAGIFPMLPEKLSTDLTSLGYGEDRPAIVIEMVIGGDGSLRSSDLYGATVRNRAKLAYNGVAEWLEGEEPAPDPIAAVEGLAGNLRIQDRVAQQLKEFRYEQGALDLETIEARPVFDGDVIRDLEAERKNRAKELIEDFMIAANGVTARYLNARKYPSLRRVVRSPKRWERIVEVASRYGATLPPEPDPKALGRFLAARKAADPLRFPDLSLTIIKLMGAGEYVAEFPEETAPGQRLRPLHGSEPAIPRSHHPTAAQGRHRGLADAVWPRRIDGAGPPLHGTGRRREQGRAPGRKIRGGHAAGAESRRAVRRDRHRRIGKGDLGPSPSPPRGRQDDSRLRRGRCRRQAPRAAGSHGRGAGVHRLQEGRLR
jgi:hypothetical protein